MATDFEADGLLEGLEGQAREARLALLQQLESEGVPTEELRTASAEGRLALVPVERILVGDSPHYTAAEVAERSGMEPEFLDRYWRAIGMTQRRPRRRRLRGQRRGRRPAPGRPA